MTKSEIIANLLASKESYKKAVDSTLQARLNLTKAQDLLNTKTNTIYTTRDIKELGSNAEIRSANIAKETAGENDLVTSSNLAFETAKAEELKARLEFDTMRYIVRLMEAPAFAENE
jgi:hypothetical protein